MSKKSFRLHVVVHEDGRRTARLLRTWDALFDRPAPSAFGVTMADIHEELEAKLEALRLDPAERIDRFLWDESFEAHKIKVDIHPLSSVEKRAVIGKKQIPLVLTYVSCPLEGGGFRVMLPRFGAWFIVEDLSLAPDVLRHAVSTFLLGEHPRWLYDFREVGDEYVAEWAPAILARTRLPDVEAAATPVRPELARVADELVERAARGKLAPVVGDSAVFDAIRAWTVGPRPPSILLVGPPGVGKSTLVRRIAAHHVAVRRERGAAPRIHSTSKDRIVAGMVYLGMWQERCATLVRELAEEGDYLHVDALGGLLEAQPDGARIADFLEPAMGELHVLTECTEEDLERARRVRPSFVQAFTIVRVPEPEAHETILLALAYARRKDLDVHPSGMKRLLRHLSLLERSVAYPGKALRFLDWLSVGPAPGTLHARDASLAYARYSGVPNTLLSDDVAASAADLAGHLRARVIGQDAACDVCGRVLARFKANLVDPDRPCGTLLFVGPTGVGKTELARQLARTTFGGVERMIRLDMSEYMRPGAVQRLIRARAGSMGLAARVRAQPLSLVLFDEIEKAHPEVFDLLLGVLGEGRMTDDAGRLVDFRTTLIVMTSNVGVADARPVGFGEAEGGDFTRKVRAHFRPELYNRIDHVVAFRALSIDDVERIVDLELGSVGSRAGLVRRGLHLRVTGRARRRLAELGHDATFGARPLKRLFEERVVTPIAARIAADPSFRVADIVVATPGEDAPGAALVVRV